jgi:protein MpaA
VARGHDVTAVRANYAPEMLRALLLATALVAPGHSVQGRPIPVLERGDPNAPVRILVVGCIHGNEQAGIAIVRRLEQITVPAGVELILVPVLNPDGVAADTRWNAHGVDLNRQFPWYWAHSPRGVFYSGPRPLSEPESRFAYALIRRVRPTISIWYHQHLTLVTREPRGNLRLERRYAQRVGLPLKWIGRFHGSAPAWENAAMPGTAAFVVELPAGALSAAAVERHANAVLALGSA